MNSLFASTARGLEELLKTELENLGAVECQVVQGGVHFKGDTRLVYQSLMWSRLASRIMLPLGECKVYSDLDLYLGVQAINWTEMFNPGATFAAPVRAAIYSLVCYCSVLQFLLLAQRLLRFFSPQAV